jgi:hypothetical protein
VGNLIYSASPIQAFLPQLVTAVVLIGAGVGGILGAGILRKQRAGSRVLMGVAGAFLLLDGAVMASLTFRAVSGRAQSISLSVDNKRVVEQSCGDNGETCPHYVLEATTSEAAYDFDVPQKAYDAIEVDQCYSFTFYPSGGLFASDESSYHSISSVTRIETADPSACP